MGRWIQGLPFFLQLAGVAGLAMYTPAIVGVALGDAFSGRTFFYGGTLTLFIVGLIGLALSNIQPRTDARNQLVGFVAGFALLPLILAVPFREVVQDTSFLNAYFEMVSALTTTGATLFDDPERLNATVHFWRALVGWLGGFLVWVTALALLQPMSLGGFEVTSKGTAGEGAIMFSQIARTMTPGERVSRNAATLAPVYGGLTLILWVLLILAGETPLVGICHAMSTLATSGISPVGGVQNAQAAWPGEAMIFLFFVFGLSRVTFVPEYAPDRTRRLSDDPEFRLGLLVTLVVPTALFLRHWIGAYEVDVEGETQRAFGALWGAFFTVLSFLTTTGFESADWQQARDWSGLRVPGMALMGLAMFGGGVATTAGGVKLLRVYALYKHGQRELEKLVHPSSVGGSGSVARHIRRQGAYIAWIFFMLFALSIAAVTAALSYVGHPLDEAMIFAVSALSTTGPLAGVAGESALSYADLGAPGKLILAAAMVVGRVEALALIALLNPVFWRT